MLKMPAFKCWLVFLSSIIFTCIAWCCFFAVDYYPMIVLIEWQCLIIFFSCHWNDKRFLKFFIGFKTPCLNQCVNEIYQGSFIPADYIYTKAVFSWNKGKKSNQSYLLGGSIDTDFQLSPAIFFCSFHNKCVLSTSDIPRPQWCIFFSLMVVSIWVAC